MGEEEHFDIKFEIEEMQNEQYSLIFTFELDSGYYFVSPNSNAHHQVLIFSIEDTDSLLMNGVLIESPRTFEEYDVLSNKGGEYVRETTKYYQDLMVNSENDFEVSGLIWFELLPTCQPYEIEFIISHSSGKLEVSKTSTTTSSYPTFWDKKRVDIKNLDKEIVY